MAYTKTNWVDEQTPLSATNMNNIENGIGTLDNEVKKHIITASCDTYTSSVKKSFMPFDNITSIGTKLTTQDNSIVIGSGVSKVKISANVQFQEGLTTSGLMEADIYINSVEKKRALNYAITTKWIGLSFAPFILDVANNDKIKLQIWNNANANYKVDGKGTWLTVEVVE